MTELLIFTLAAPLASFGDIAPGERRLSASRPGHSALVGMIAAALGLKRDDPRQRPLASDLHFAVRIDQRGSSMTDYHTTQTAAAKKGRRFATRAQELDVDDPVTILSQREYRTDSAFTVAVLAQTALPFSLKEIAAALRQPHFILSAGRKACPLALPPSPRIFDADSLLAAFANYDQAENSRDNGDLTKYRGMLGMLTNAASATYVVAYTSAFAQLLPSNPAQRRELRRDFPVDRSRWQFAQREECLIDITPASVGATA